MPEERCELGEIRETTKSGRLESGGYCINQEMFFTSKSLCCAAQSHIGVSADERSSGWENKS